MVKKKVWILDDEWFTHDVEMGIYDAHDMEYKVTRSDTFEEDFEAFGKYADGVVAQIGFPCSGDTIAKLENCKIIAASGVGFNHIDLAMASDKGIYVTNMPDYCIDEVSDHTIALALTVARRLRAYNEQVKSLVWNPLDTLPIKRLRGRTVGLLGFGRIAKEVARKFKVFGLEVIAHDQFIANEDFAENEVESVTLDALLERSDILSLHVPLTKETEGLLGYDRLKQMKEGSILINTCRGGIIQEDALIKLLKEDHLAGAGLDVLTEEPPGRDQELLHMEEVFITPHSSYVSVESEYELRSRTSLNVIRAIQGKTPEFIQNVVPVRTG